MKKGSHHKPESIAKNAAAHTGKVYSVESRRKMGESRTGERNPFYGRHHDPETIEKNRQAHLGKPAHNKGVPMSEEQKEKIRQAKLGKKHKPETKQKMSESHKKNPVAFWKGKEIPEETKEKLRIINIGKTHTKEAKQKIREANTGIIRGEETRKKISLTHIGLLSGKKNPAYKDGSSKLPYCMEFSHRTKERVRLNYGNKCVLCGKTPEENGSRLSVHHVFTEKQACCEGNINQISDMDNLRKRLPKGIGNFGEPLWGKEELYYIRMMIPLCKKCHAPIQFESDDLPFEETVLRKKFVELILNKFNGKYILTKEEYMDLLQK